MSAAPSGSGTATQDVLLPVSKSSPWRKLMGAWDHAAIYIPALMMALLALGTYWLVRNTPVFGEPEAPQAISHDVDYFMRTFTVKTFDEAGQLKSEIQGAEARHFPDTDVLEIDQARIRSINPLGQLTTASGNRAYSNGDGSEVQLVGNAIVTRQAGKSVTGVDTPQMEFRGEFLHAFLNEERVTSHKPVVLTRGLDRFTGDTFAYDNLDQVANLKGRVRGVLMPKTQSAAGNASTGR